MRIEPDLLSKLDRTHPDNLNPYGGNRPGKATIFWGVRNQTLYTGTTHRSVHNGVMQDHPEIVREILPPDIYERMQAGEFRHPTAGNNQLWQVVSVFALMGRLGGAHGHDVVSLWPRSRSGVEYEGGELGASSFFRPEAEIPKLLRALMGRGKSVHFGIEPPRIDGSWVLTMMDEMVPTLAGELLDGVGSSGAPPQGRDIL